MKLLKHNLTGAAALNSYKPYAYQMAENQHIFILVK